MTSTNKIGIALTILFAVSLLALTLEILYVLWRRRLFLRRSLSPPSKDLIYYYFCWKNVQNSTRVEPEAASRDVAATPELPPPETEEDDVLKWYSTFGPSRVLFTIKEEEKEEMELAADNIININYDNNNNIVNIIEISSDFEVSDTTPFSTPCGSPSYYTPSPSPTRD